MVTELLALSESSDDVMSKRQFSQECCKLEIPTYRTNSEGSTKIRGQEYRVADGACAKDTSQWTRWTSFFCCCLSYGTLIVKVKGVFVFSSIVYLGRILPFVSSRWWTQPFFFSSAGQTKGVVSLIPMILHMWYCILWGCFCIQVFALFSYVVYPRVIYFLKYNYDNRSLGTSLSTLQRSNVTQCNSSAMASAFHRDNNVQPEVVL